MKRRIPKDKIVAKTIINVKLNNFELTITEFNNMQNPIIEHGITYCNLSRKSAPERNLGRFVIIIIILICSAKHTNWFIDIETLSGRQTSTILVKKTLVIKKDDKYKITVN